MAARDPIRRRQIAAAGAAARHRAPDADQRMSELAAARVAAQIQRERNRLTDAHCEGLAAMLLTTPGVERAGVPA